ncbi:MAG: dihydrolipoamide acetyltransferase family protein [Hyphomicrobiaceae bacterium]
MTTFTLPDLGEGLQDAEIVAWHVGVGDTVVADQPLVSVETAKAVVEIPSPWSGRVVSLHAKPGDVVPVGANLIDIEPESTTQDRGTVVGALPHAAPAVQAPAPATAQDTGVRAKMSPAVRNRATQLGIDVATVAGTGPDGAITLEDIEAAARAIASGSGYQPLRGVRRAMAETLAKSAAGVVPATVSDEAVIAAWTANADPTVRLVRAVVAGCRAAPSLNAWFDARAHALRLHEVIDLGIAVETSDGLFAPVVRNVGNRSDADIRSALEAIKRDVAARSVPLSELRGQTISLSNFGMLGGLTAHLTIVEPQVAILGAGRIHNAVREVDGEIRGVPVMPLSLTFDHRVVTGAEAITFLNAAISELSKP